MSLKTDLYRQKHLVTVTATGKLLGPKLADTTKALLVFGQVTSIVRELTVTTRLIQNDHRPQPHIHIAGLQLVNSAQLTSRGGPIIEAVLSITVQPVISSSRRIITRQ